MGRSSKPSLLHALRALLCFYSTAARIERAFDEVEGSPANFGRKGNNAVLFAELVLMPEPGSPKRRRWSLPEGWQRRSV